MARKQKELPGIPQDPERIASIEDANEDLRAIKAKLRKLRDDKVAAEIRVRSELRNHNRTEYRYRSEDGVGRKVELLDEVKVKQTKVRTTSRSEDAGEGDGDDAGETAH